MKMRKSECLHFQLTAVVLISAEGHSYPQPGVHRVSQGLLARRDWCWNRVVPAP